MRNQSIINGMIILVRSTKEIFNIWSDFCYCFFAFLNSDKRKDNDNSFEDKDYYTDKDCKIAETWLFIIVSSPGCCPIDNPN